MEIRQMSVSQEHFLKIAETVKSFPKDTPITFSFVISALFPDAWNNIQNALKDAHMQGYLQAKEEI